MARPRKPLSLSVSSSQAHYVLEKAVADRKLSAADVDHYVASMHHEISTLEHRLASLRDAIVEPVKHFVHKVEEKVWGGDGPFPAPETKPAKKARKKRVSAARKASMQLQGQYLGLIQKFPKSKREGFKAMARKDGRENAIAAMKKALGREGNG
jgi:hypothetical protein